jgi:hypothetical protein
MRARALVKSCGIDAAPVGTVDVWESFQARGVVNFTGGTSPQPQLRYCDGTPIIDFATWDRFDLVGAARVYHLITVPTCYTMCPQIFVSGSPVYTWRFYGRAQRLACPP